MKNQYKIMTMAALAFILFFGSGLAMATDEFPRSLTFDEADIHKPIFVVSLENDNTEVVRGNHAIYRIFLNKGSLDESANPALNLWTDQNGSKRVQR